MVHTPIFYVYAYHIASHTQTITAAKLAKHAYTGAPEALHNWSRVNYANYIHSFLRMRKVTAVYTRGELSVCTDVVSLAHVTEPQNHKTVLSQVRMRIRLYTFEPLNL